MRTSDDFLLAADLLLSLAREPSLHVNLVSCPGDGAAAAGLVVPPASLGNAFLQRPPEPAAVGTQRSVGADGDPRLCYEPADPSADP